jgi:long-chain acyl-CoA synthetase
MATIASVQRALPMNDSDVTIVNLSLAHSLQRIGAWNAIANGSTQVFGDRLDRFSSHLTQFNPTVQLSVPRMFEKFYGAIHEDLLGQDLRRRKMFEWALDVARQVKQCEREGRRPPRHMRLQLVAAERTVLGPLRERFGGRIRFFISGAAPLSAEIIEFFEALGMPVYEGYGLTETCAPATVNTPSDHKLNTVGKPLDICELRVERDGEILIRGENVTSGYYRDEASTEEAFDADGWFKTGDLGVIDQDGFLRITGRKKDLIITAGGKNVSPANVETAFEREALIKHCVVFGDRQKYLVALFDLDTEALARFVERFDLHDLTEEQQRTHPQVVAEVQLITDRVNRTLARFETVKYFSVVPESLSVEDGFLTPTLKVKRQRVFDRYETEIMNLYETRRKRQESLW